MIMHVENTKESIKKLLEAISKFSEVIENKVDTWESIVFLYITSEQFKKWKFKIPLK